MRVNIIDLLWWLIDSALVFWFFVPVQPQKHLNKAIRGSVAFLYLLAVLPIYVFSIYTFPWDIARFFYRSGLYALYLHFCKRIRWDWCVYFSIMGWLSFNICSHTYIAPLIWKSAYLSRLPEFFLNVFPFALLRLVVVTVVSRAVPFAHEQPPGSIRFSFMLFLCTIQIYTRSTLQSISVELYTGMGVYLLLLQLLLGASMVFFERYLDSRRLQEEDRLASVASNYRYENAMAQQVMQEDLRRIHHDMKNHLLVMQNLAWDNQRLNDYISTLMNELSASEYQTDTGNTLLDGLLGNKLHMAAQKGVACAVALDFRPCSYMADPDVCTIFGNILDNAIEAAQQVLEPQERSILLKSTQAANQLIITCSNYYTGMLELSDGLPQTTKIDRSYHGIGLSSVRRSVEKYGGVLSLRICPDQRLCLIILLPAETPPP